jgi:DNA-directed RNA polymerase subunit H
MPEKKQHILVPVHKKLSEKEKEEFLKKYSITLKDMPAILANDPAISDLDAKEGDVIMVLRKSRTAGKSMYYRRVSNG